MALVSLSPLDVVRLSGMLVAVTLLVMVARNRRERGVVPIIGVLCAVVLWLTGDFVAAQTSGVAATLYWGKLTYTAAPLLVFFVLLFVCQYTDILTRLDSPLVGLLAIEPVVIIVGIWTNQSHGLFLSDPRLSAATYWGVDFSLGPLFYAHAVYAYVTVLVAAWLVVRLLFESQSLYPRQVYLILAGILGPSVTDLLYQLGVLRIDMTPVALTFSGLLLTMALSRFRLLDVSPVARHSVVENIRDGLFVVGRDGEFIECNSIARATLGLPESPVGQRIDDILDDHPDLLAYLERTVDDESEFTLDTTAGPREFRVQVTGLTDHRGAVIGRQVILQDITDRVERERELERQNEQLDRFAGVVSHDLRNPLNIASARTELLREETSGVTDHLDSIEGAHDRMSDLIDDMLTLARDGQTIAETERVQLPTVARAAWDNTATGDTTLTIDTDLVLDADPDRLRRLFENLFRNASEHAGEDATIEIGALADATESDAVGFCVADDGPGIPPAKRDRVLDDGFTTEGDGTGLGLSIVASIVEAHGWQIDVTESASGGARFEVRAVRSATEAGDMTDG